MLFIHEYGGVVYCVRAYKFRLNSSESSIYYRFYVFIFYKFGKISFRSLWTIYLFRIKIYCFYIFIGFSPNIIRLLLGWDGLEVTSYLLVIFYQSNKSYNADIITVLTNRLGECWVPRFCFNYIGLRRLKIFIFTRRSLDFLYYY